MEDHRVLEVGSVAAPVLRAVRTGTSPAESLHTELMQAYHGTVADVVSIPGYSVMWIDGQWVVVCTQTRTLGVPFEDGTVELDVSETIRLT